MKADLLQGDFSAAEVSPRAQGHVGTDIYKAALSRAANVAPTRVGTVASRAGGQFFADPVIEQLPVRHFEVPNGPYGDFIVEIGSRDIRLMDKYGINHWHAPTDPNYLTDGTQLGYTDVWYDAASRSLYINNSDGSGPRVVDIAPNAITPNAVGFPAGTNESWSLDYILAGDSVTLRVTNFATSNYTDYVLTRGANRITFGVIDAGNPGFDLKIRTQDGVVTASTIWGLKLTKNAMTTSKHFGFVPFPNLLTVRHSPGFWAPDGKFYVLFVGGGATDIWALRWTPPVGAMDAVWDFNILNYVNTDTDFDKTQISTVTVYNSRIWLGMSNKQASLYGSLVGYGSTTRNDPAGIANVIFNGAFQFKFGAASVSWASDGVLAFANFDFKCLPTGSSIDDGAQLSVSVNGVLKSYKTDYLTALNGDQSKNPGGSIIWQPVAPVPAAQVVKITRAVPLAADPLTLKLASPTGRICWMNVLRGLVFGTTETEKTLQGLLAIDGATGQSPDLLDHSSVGSDENLPALSVHEKIVFLQRGRTIVRQASVRFNWESGEPQSGLISEDAGVYGEHLTASGVRSLCFLKGPVPRLVFAFDDGTAAVATPGGVAGMAWSRLTIPDRFGGVYAVAALNTVNGSQLWVSTENGVTLFFDSFESDIKKKTRKLPQAIPASGVRIGYDTETPLPPVMDGWTRVAGFRTGTRIGLEGPGNGGTIAGKRPVSESLLGQSVYVMTNGQVFGPFVVKNDLGTGDYRVDDAGVVPLGFTWQDASNLRRAQDVYVGLALPEHRFVTLPLEGGNPAGTAQGYQSRRVQCYVRFVDSYMPLVGTFRAPERGGSDPTDLVAGRVTGDRRITQLGFDRGATLEIKMDLPLRMEISAIFGGTQVSST